MKNHQIRNVTVLENNVRSFVVPLVDNDEARIRSRINEKNLIECEPLERRRKDSSISFYLRRISLRNSNISKKGANSEMMKRIQYL